MVAAGLAVIERVGRIRRSERDREYRRFTSQLAHRYAINFSIPFVLMWSYEFYRDREGNEPVREFILSLDKKPRGKVLQTIQVLSEFGPTLPFPYSSQVEGKLWGLRAHYGKTLYRILYYRDTQGTFMLLPIFAKKTPKVPEREIKIARERMFDHQTRKRGG